MRKRKMIYLILSLVLLALLWVGRLTWIAAGRAPQGERLLRCIQSEHWHDGEFRNLHATPQLTSDRSMAGVFWDFLFKTTDGLKPHAAVPTAKSDLLHLPRAEERVVWLGHSSLFVQTGGVRFLFDPVLTSRLPVSFFMKPFRGTDVYTPDDIPDVDYLIITHDHWDHLDYATVTALRDRVGNVVCGLGVGEHFEYWGYEREKIHDLDWGDSLVIDRSAGADGQYATDRPQFTIRCLPSRHFSGRLFGRNRTLWASYLIDGPRRIFVSGDGGYDDRFEQIGRKYPGIDLAVMENGQYNADWRYIHTLPSELPRAIEDLGAQRVLTYHNSKYALARHRWTEPLDSIYEYARTAEWKLLTPKMGQPVDLRQDQTFPKWWKSDE